VPRFRQLGYRACHSIRINEQWRLIFQWDGGRGEARGVRLDDNSYR
jgi:toxin HigB-1